MRDKIAHFYFGVDYDIVWNVAKEKLPLIKPKLQKILKDVQASTGKAHRSTPRAQKNS